MSAGHGLDTSVFGNGHSNGKHAFDLASISSSLHKVASSSTLGNSAEDEDEFITFESAMHEAAYYKDKYRQATELLHETRAELDEFQISSRELETELEKELEENENKQAELRDRINRLESEKEDWKTKFVNLQKMHSSTTAAMQREMDNLRSERDKALVAVRDLEMGNDQLERNERVAMSSLLDMEIRYNRAIEEKTLLEQEVIQKNELEEELQRLKDDVRDGNNEIAILRDQLARAVVPTPPASDTPMSPAATDRALNSRATTHSDMRSDSRLDPPSPTPTDSSSSAEPSTRRPFPTDKPTGTPRQGIPVHGSPRRVPRSTSTPTGLISPMASKRTTAALVASPSTSGIPSLARSTASRPSLGGNPQPLGMSMANRRVLGTATTNAANAVATTQATKNKGFKLLHDLQARIKTTDDKIGKMVKKAPAGFSRRPAAAASGAASSAASTSSSNSTTQSGLSISTMRARTASRGRAANLAMSVLTSSTATVTSASNSSLTSSTATVTMRDDKSVGMLSPSSWVLLSDAEDTPPTSLRQPHTPTSPLDRSTSRPPTTRRSTLPTRPSIPSPLVRETKARHLNTESMKIRHGLSASTMVPPTAPRQRPMLTASTTRPPSRGHVRASSTVAVRSGATSPSHIPGPRRLSMGVGVTLDLASPTATGPVMSGGSGSASASSSRPQSRVGVRSHTPTTRSHTPGGSISSMSGIPQVPPPRRPPRRSSVGIIDDGQPPSGIPGPKLAGLGRPASLANTPPPPVPRIPSMVRERLYETRSPI